MSALDDAGIVSGSLVAAGILLRGVVWLYQWQRNLSRTTDAQDALMHGDPIDPKDPDNPDRWRGIKVEFRDLKGLQQKNRAGIAELRRNQDYTASVVTKLGAAWIPNGGSAEIDKIKTSLSAIEQVVTAEARKPDETT